MYASVRGHLSRVKVTFILRSADHTFSIKFSVFRSEFNGAQSILRLFLLPNQTTVVQTLIAQGAALDIGDNSQRTALMLASEKGHLSTVEVGFIWKLIKPGSMAISVLTFLAHLSDHVCNFDSGANVLLHRRSLTRGQQWTYETVTSKQP